MFICIALYRVRAMFVESVSQSPRCSNWIGHIYRGIEDFWDCYPAIWLTLRFRRNLIVRGAQPKTRYCGHVNSRLVRRASQQHQTNRVSNYMRESKKNEYGNGKFEYASTSRVMKALVEYTLLVNSRSGSRSNSSSNTPKKWFLHWDHWVRPWSQTSNTPKKWFLQWDCWLRPWKSDSWVR